MKILSTILVLVIISIFTSGCQQKDRKVENIKTFARLYGYARWFHPSDEASEIDWDKFAIYGVQQVENCSTDKELINTLTNLFTPFVQGLQFYEADNTHKNTHKSLIPEDHQSKKFTSWQHYGVYLGERSNIYKSYRTNTIPKDAFSAFNRYILDATQYIGKEVKLSGYFKVEPHDASSKASIYIRPVKEGESFGSFRDYISTASVGIDSDHWEHYDLTYKIEEGTKYIAYGGLIENNIELWADDIIFSIKNGQEWESMNNDNPGFEKGENADNVDGWDFNTSMHTIEVMNGEAYSGNYFLKAGFSGKLLDIVPAFDEFIDKQIGPNLYCTLPLSLAIMDNKTFPRSNQEKFNNFKTKLDSLAISKTEEIYRYLGSTVIAWNVLQHFYPYFDVIDTNWDFVLQDALNKIYTCKMKTDYYIAFCTMVAELDDGHGIVYGARKEYHLKIRTEWIDDNIVVTASEDPLFRKGDIILTIDGMPAEETLHEIEQTVSGSPQLKKHRALNIFGSKFTPDSTLVTISRNGKLETLMVRNTQAGKSLFFNQIIDFTYQNENIIEIEPGIIYVNMRNATPEVFRDWMDRMAQAESIIYDNRWGGRLSFFEIIPHLIDTTVRSAWWNIPQVIYPDREKMEFFKTNWTMEPESPHFKSKNYILNAPSVVSSGETTMGIIDHYNLAVTIGETTAGCNGNINWINLPCGFNIMFTGMKVLKHDETQHHLIGFIPDYPIDKSIQAVIEGKDETLEKALELARK